LQASSGLRYNSGNNTMKNKINHDPHDGHKHSLRRQVLIPLGILLALLLITSLVVLYARGYRLGFGKGTPSLAKTGILHAVSNPKGAQVYINDHLTSATDNSINLTPGQDRVPQHLLQMTSSMHSQQPKLSGLLMGNSYSQVSQAHLLPRPIICLMLTR